MNRTPRTERDEVTMNEAKSDGLSVELQHAIESTIKQRLDEERNFLASTIGLAAKVAGGAIALALGTLTLFGIRNFSDIQTRIETTAQDQIEKYLRSESAISAVQRRLDRMYVASLISFNQAL